MKSMGEICLKLRLGRLGLARYAMSAIQRGLGFRKIMGSSENQRFTQGGMCAT